MLFTIVGSGLFVVLGLASLPLPAVRQALLMLMHRLLHLGVFALTLACAVLFFLPAEQVPSTIQSAARPLGELLDLVWPASWDCPGRLWLVLALTLGCVLLPILTLIDCAARFARHARWVEKQERREKSQAASKSVKLDRPAPRRLGDLLEKSNV